MRVVLILVATLVSGPILAIAGAPVPHDTTEPVLVILPPWHSAQALVETAHGRIIGLTRAPFGVLAVGDRPDFISQLIDGGAWTVRDGRALAELCGRKDA